MEITFNIANVCNLNCSYCIFVGKGSKEKIHIDLVKSLSCLINYYLDRGERTSLTFAGGGEPLLFFHEIKLVIENLKVRNKDIFDIYLITNGTLYSSEISNFVKEYSINLILSLDGIKEEHDRNRTLTNGDSSYNLILKNRDVLSLDVKEVNYTIYYNNFQKLLDGIKFISENFKNFRRLNLNFVFNDSHWKDFVLSSLKVKLNQFIYWYIGEKKFLFYETNLRNYGFVGTNQFDEACISHLYIDKDGKIFKCGAYKFLDGDTRYIGDLYSLDIENLEKERLLIQKCGTKCSIEEFAVENNKLKKILQPVGKKYLLIEKYIPLSKRKPTY